MNESNMGMADPAITNNNNFKKKQYKEGLLNVNAIQWPLQKKNCLRAEKVANSWTGTVLGGFNLVGASKRRVRFTLVQMSF